MPEKLDRNTWRRQLDRLVRFRSGWGRWLREFKQRNGFCVNDGCWGALPLLTRGECIGCYIKRFIAEVEGRSTAESNDQDQARREPRAATKKDDSND